MTTTQRHIDRLIQKEINRLEAKKAKVQASWLVNGMKKTEAKVAKINQLIEALYEELDARSGV